MEPPERCPHPDPHREFTRLALGCKRKLNQEILHCPRSRSQFGFGPKMFKQLPKDEAVEMTLGGPSLFSLSLSLSLSLSFSLSLSPPLSPHLSLTPPSLSLSLLVSWTTSRQGLRDVYTHHQTQRYVKHIGPACRVWSPPPKPNPDSPAHELHPLPGAATHRRAPDQRERGVCATELRLRDDISECQEQSCAKKHASREAAGEGELRLY